MTKYVDIRSLKDKALKWPEPVKTLVLSEADSVTVDEFLTKLEIWERLLKIQKGGF